MKMLNYLRRILKWDVQIQNGLTSNFAQQKQAEAFREESSRQNMIMFLAVIFGLIISLITLIATLFMPSK
jgi:type IV secretory pathway component VirB8